MWYSSGTITATNNNTVIIGVGTTPPCKVSVSVMLNKE